MTRHPNSPKSFATKLLPLPIPPVMPMTGFPRNMKCAARRLRFSILPNLPRLRDLHPIPRRVAEQERLGSRSQAALADVINLLRDELSFRFAKRRDFDADRPHRL